LPKGGLRAVTASVVLPSTVAVFEFFDVDFLPDDREELPTDLVVVLPGVSKVEICTPDESVLLRLSARGAFKFIF
jgi:hypothetical protein